MTKRESGNNEAFDNEAFWNRRYRDNPELGSGVGSRGQNLLHKRSVISAFLDETSPASVLDVGCGDFEVLKGVGMTANYLGLDISPAIVETNRKRFLGKSFDCVNFLAVEDIDMYKADVVLCFEVLIHQHAFEDYIGLLLNIVRATSHQGLISGYVSDPRPSIKSDIIAWHEPLLDSLARVGARDTKIRTRSLEADSLAFVSFCAQRT